MDWGELMDFWEYQVGYWRERLVDGKVAETPKGFAVEAFAFFNLARVDSWRWLWSELEP